MSTLDFVYIDSLINLEVRVHLHLERVKLLLTMCMLTITVCIPWFRRHCALYTKNYLIFHCPTYVPTNVIYQS